MDYTDGEEVKDWAKYLQRRCLVVEDRPLGYSIEVFVLEISPSGKRVKFRFPSGSETWEAVEEWLLIEALV
jgi:hypothetical protein